MDEVLRCLADTGRLEALRLLAERPMKQAELAREIARSQGVEELNPGSTFRLLQPLFTSGLIVRPSPRGACSLAHPEATEAALQAIGRLARSVATTQHERASATEEMGGRLAGDDDRDQRR